MKTIEIDTEVASFEYNGKTYNCELVVKRDIQHIKHEAETNHKEEFDEKYDKDSITPNKVRLYVDENGYPLYMMMTYVIKYKSKEFCTFGYGRYACGEYYPIDNNFDKIYPHPFQGSICW